MRRPVTLLAALLSFNVLALTPSAAQQPRQRQSPGAPPLRAEAKLRYIGQQLFLDKEQAEAYEQMIGEVWVRVRDETTGIARESPERIRELFSKLHEARQADDKGAVEEIEREIKMLSPVARADAEFDRAIKEQILKPEQVKLLAKARARLALNPSGQLRPIDVIYAARDTGLTPEQQKKVAELMKTYRHRMFKEVAPADTIARALLREELVAELRQMLTPEQGAQFDRTIAALRVSPPPSKPAQPEGGEGAEGATKPEKKEGGNHDQP